MDKHLEQLLTCSVCLDRFNVPKTLPCQHTFCMNPCLQNLVVDKVLRCPQCRCNHRLPRSGVAALPNNLTIIALLELPSAVAKNNNENCEECLKENCKPDKCSHCNKKLCQSCTNVHSQQLLQGLTRSVNQVRRELPKISEMITQLEERQVKSVSLGNSVKAEVNQAIERCMTELKNRQNALLDHVDLFVSTESRHLKVEQETLEMELATLSSHCEAAEKKSKNFSASTNSASKVELDEISQLTRESQEHLRNIRTISSSIEDSIHRTVKFHREREKSLLNTVADFGEITYSSPTRVSLTLGSDPLLNENEVNRVMQNASFGRRAEAVPSYIPSFSSPSTNTPSPSGGNFQHLQLSTSPGPTNDAPNPVSSVHFPRRRRRHHIEEEDRSSSYFSLSPPSVVSSHLRSSLISSVEDLNALRRLQLGYKAKGSVKRKFGVKGSGLGCLNWPRGVAVTSDDKIVVADSSNHRVHMFEVNGETSFTFGGYGNDEAHFDCLAAVHVTAQGWMVITDRYNHRIQIFDSMGRFIRMFGEEGSGEGELSYPWGVATDNMGFVYVCDKDNHRVQVFTLDGQFIRKFGRIGTHDGQFDSPQYLAITNDNKVFVSDSGNHRVQVFDKYGRFLFKFGREGSANGQLKYPRGIAVDLHGDVIVGDSGNNRVQVFKPDGSYVTSFGSWGPEPGQMKGIEGVALLSNHDIVVSDRENHRIQIF